MERLVDESGDVSQDVRRGEEERGKVKRTVESKLGKGGMRDYWDDGTAVREEEQR